MAVTWTVLVAGKTTSGSIANWVNRGDLPTENVLIEAEAWIYERLRVREMQASEAFQFDENASSEALPSGFLDPLHFLPYTWGDYLPFWALETFVAGRDEDGNLFEGTPCAWTIEGETAKVDVKCSDNFAGMLTYYDTPTALSVSNTTNFLTRRYPKLLRVAAMATAFEHMKDSDRAAAYFQGAEALVMEAHRTNDSYRRGPHA